MEHVIRTTPRGRQWLLWTVIASAGIAVATFVGGAVRRSKRIRKREERLDEALEASMDCSDPVASY